MSTMDDPNLREAIRHSEAATCYTLKAGVVVVVTAVFCVLWISIFHDELRSAHSEFETAQGMWRLCQGRMMDGMDLNLDKKASLCREAWARKVDNPFLRASVNTMDRLFGWFLPQGMSGMAVGLMAAMVARVIENTLYSLVGIACLSALVWGLVHRYCRASRHESELQSLYMTNASVPRDIAYNPLDNARVPNRGAFVQLLADKSHAD